jgi:cobalt/nickel transport system permease protein
VSGVCAGDPAQTGLAGDPRSAVHRLAPQTKVVGLVGVTLVAVSAGPAQWPVWGACLAVLAAVATLARIGARVVVRRARVVLPIVVLAALFLPFVRHGGSEVRLGPLTASAAGLAALAAVTAKATIGTLSAVVLGATTPFADALRALERLRVPRLFVLIAQTTYRYLFVVVEETRRTRRALLARGFAPRHALQAAAVGRVAGSLFLRAHARGERTHRAMLARGFAGMIPAAPHPRPGRADAAFAAAVPGMLVALRVLEGLA